MSEAPRPRGSVVLYAAAFASMIAAAAVLALSARDFLESISLLWVSAALSAAAIVLAVLGVVGPRRR